MPINMSIEYPKLEKKVMELQRKNAELLDACKKALNVFESEPDLSFYKAHKELIKSAIAKAEGK